jgi:hypothetical protein
MKNLRLVAIATGTLFVTTSAVMVACTSDDTAVSNDAGTEASADTGAPDTSTPDTSTPDTSTPDTGTDAGLKLETFAAEVGAAMCNALARCCFGNAKVPEGGADGGNFDTAHCQQLYKDIGFENSDVGQSALTSGNVTIDQAKGADCLAKIDTLACSLTGPAMQTIRTACFGAIIGKVANGSSCRSSIECATGYCDPTGDAGTTDGGTGSCAPLLAQGANCSVFSTGRIDKDAIQDEEACSYRGSGTPGLRCNSLDSTGNYNLDRTQWTCQPTIGNTAAFCNSTVWCASGLCDPDSYTCVSPAQYFSKYSCQAEIKLP